MPPSGFNKKAIEGSIQFIGSCYEDLLQEVRDGKHSSFEKAIEFELSNIKKALEKLHLDSDGNLIEIN